MSEDSKSPKKPEKDLWEPLYMEPPKKKENHPLVQAYLEGNASWFEEALVGLKNALDSLDEDYFLQAAEAVRLRKAGEVNDIVDRIIYELWSLNYGDPEYKISISMVQDKLPAWARKGGAYVSESTIRRKLDKWGARKRKPGEH